jgi:hypothetical protein
LAAAWQERLMAFKQAVILSAILLSEVEAMASFEPRIGSWIFQGFEQVCVDSSGCPHPSSYSLQATFPDANGDLRDSRDRGFGISCDGDRYQIIYDTGRRAAAKSAQRISMTVTIDKSNQLMLLGEAESPGYAGNVTIRVPLSPEDFAALGRRVSRSCSPVLDC